MLIHSQSVGKSPKLNGFILFKGSKYLPTAESLSLYENRAPKCDTIKTIFLIIKKLGEIAHYVISYRFLKML